MLFHRFDVADVLRLIEKYRVTFTVASITVYTALLNHPDSRKHDITSFKKAYSGARPPNKLRKQADMTAKGHAKVLVLKIIEETSKHDLEMASKGACPQTN